MPTEGKQAAPTAAKSPSACVRDLFHRRFVLIRQKDLGAS
jgi:hypothetical protein